MSLFDHSDRRRRTQDSIRRSMRDLQRAGRGGLSLRLADAAWQRLIRGLGPFGWLLSRVYPDTPQRPQMDAILRAVGLLRPDLAPGLPAPGRSTSAGRRPLRPPVSPDTDETVADEGPRVFEADRPALPFGGFRGNPDDPVYNGQMIRVSSSNVHSIGFRWNAANPSQGTLIVRYLQKGRPGPEYEYDRVHPLVFEALRTAESKGRFVWDRLRVRGTVSGHRYHYQLTGIAGGYVPRQAKRYGDNEYFVTRSITAQNARTGERRRFQSQLPDQFARRVRSIQLLPGGRRVPLVQR